ncbi:hypothetical protein [Streptomyces sp. S186]|uniref:hypothetical protein n=1 Tax=Streptomyces sp. S186 TaxID=3434395 RepID=UPI003F665F16
MSNPDPMMEALKMYKEENERLKRENEELRKQQGSSGQSGQSGQASQSAEKIPTRLKAGDATGHIGRLAGDTVLVRLTTSDGEGIEGQTVRFYVGGKEVGSDLTDANGEIRTNAGQHAGQPLNWINALASGYTAEFEGSKKYKPSHTQAGVHVGA